MSWFDTSWPTTPNNWRLPIASSSSAAGTARLFSSPRRFSELVWVLERCYQQTKDEVLAVLDAVVGTPEFQMEHGDLVRQSLDAYREGKANFADYLIGAIGRWAGCQDVVTFDRDLRGATGFTVIA